MSFQKEFHKKVQEVYLIDQNIEWKRVKWKSEWILIVELALKSFSSLRNVILIIN
jgi:hypothetical protein